jgi:DNA-binding IclR family transcriptional regulator
MPSQTELIFSTLGKRDPLRLLTALTRGAANETELAERAKIEKSAASRSLAQLRLLGLVERDSPKAPYRMAEPELTAELLRRANDLGRELAARRLAAQDELESL